MCICIARGDRQQCLGGGKRAGRCDYIAVFTVPWELVINSDGNVMKSFPGENFTTDP